MRGEIHRLHQRLGTTSLFVTHDQVEAVTLADRIVVMNAGRMEQIATPHEIFNRPASLFVADFVGSPGFNLVEGAYDSSSYAFVMNGGERLQVDQRQMPSVLPSLVILGFHAESAVLSTNGEGLAFRVDYVEELGSTKHVQGLLGEQKIIIATKSDHMIPATPDFHLALKPDDLHFLYPVSGRRLG